MLRNTFCHIPNIGLKKEFVFWKQGLTSWKKFYESRFKMSAKQDKRLRYYLDESMEQLKRRNISYFYQRLPEKQQWRLFREFRKRAVYLDIEAAGQKEPNNYISTISLYDGKNVFCYVYGKNLHDFCADIRKYDLIITYSGKSFDIPYIEKYFNITLDHAHIDLRYILKDLGYTGGLKGCERSLGIDRNMLDGVDGYFAVLLWKEYIKKKNEKALETLLAYNISDVVNLEILMIKAYNMNVKHLPIQKRKIVLPASPEIQYSADLSLLNRIRRNISRRRTSRRK